MTFNETGASNFVRVFARCASHYPLHLERADDYNLEGVKRNRRAGMPKLGEAKAFC